MLSYLDSASMNQHLVKQPFHREPQVQCLYQLGTFVDFILSPVVTSKLSSTDCQFNSSVDFDWAGPTHE